MTHPSGIGLWAVALRGVGWPVFVTAHTAREAWQAAGPRLGWPDYAACSFVLLSDRASDQPAEERPAPRPEVVQAVRRRLRRQGVTA